MHTRLLSDFASAYKDILGGIANWRVALILGRNDVRNRYNRSKLGVFWASLSILIFVAAIGPIYARLMNVDSTTYMLHLLLGFIAWNYLSGIIMECGREYINASNYIVSFQLTYFTLLLRVVLRNLVVVGYQMLVFLILALVLNHSLSVQWLFAPLALLAVTLNALWLGLLMSVFATRFRDISELMNNLFRLVFFITPIIWMPDLSPELTMVADLNPFFHFIEIFRAPLVSGEINLRSWAIVLLLAVIGWLVAFMVFAKYRKRLAFWV